MLLGLAFRLGRAPLVRALGAERVAEARRRAVRELPGILALLPPTPGKAGAHYFLSAACHLVAFHRAVGLPAAESTALLRDALKEASRWVPRPIRWLYRWLYFQPWFFRRVTDGTFGGGGFEGEAIALGPGAMGVDYTACGIQLFLHRIGEGELGPHICSLDELESEVFDLGLIRTGTIGRGAPRCDFRWQRPGSAGSPPAALRGPPAGAHPEVGQPALAPPPSGAAVYSPAANSSSMAAVQSASVPTTRKKGQS